MQQLRRRSEKLFDKPASLLIANLNHPSLHAKKYSEGLDLWQARVNRDWRFYFTIKREVYQLLEIVKHPK